MNFCPPPQGGGSRLLISLEASGRGVGGAGAGPPEGLKGGVLGQRPGYGFQRDAQFFLEIL